MSEKKLCRSNEPIFWGLFGAGGMWSAIFFPITIVIVTLILPFASMPMAMHIIELSASWLGRSFILLSIILPLWCGLHRIHHTLHDMKIYIPAEKLIIYGCATLMSLLAIYIVFTL